MSTISAAAVMALRNRTNAPMMDCKAALTEANGDMEKAAEILRKQNKTIQDKKGARETAEARASPKRAGIGDHISLQWKKSFGRNWLLAGTELLGQVDRQTTMGPYPPQDRIESYLPHA